MVVLEGITIGGKSVREHPKVLNHKDAILFLEELVTDNGELSAWNIKNIHMLILKEVDNKNAGKYREENVIISGVSKNPVDFRVPEQMEKLIFEYDTWISYHPLIRVALLYSEFVFILLWMEMVER